ncbi:cysteine hydrolase family protein [Hymenobacter artigasi]|uniref:Nicotinamidase-related amidase n=1 Tax=Hymenobacter artigasi TaxID=2719616 RepID=A0ABX1HQF2_9BACT|nr:cysteine hydrolase family protein [Hymenobacter artigasi]NKI91343.1 nicotinamidase-related amidase [Hymenobacter artigasi]
MSKALIVVDVQNDYFENGAMELVGPLPVSENVKLLLEKFRAEKLPVVHIHHLGVGPDATFFLPGTKGAEIHANVQPLDGEKVIMKYYPNSFRDTDLLAHLQGLGIKELVITGMMTHMCIDATTRAARDFGFECTVIGDACATKDLEVNGAHVKAAEVQTAFLAALAFFYASIQTTKQYLAA